MLNLFLTLFSLQLIQVWAETFRNQPDLSGVVLSYQELRNKGIVFPAPEIESVVPIYTPQRVSVIFVVVVVVVVYDEGGAVLYFYQLITRPVENGKLCTYICVLGD